MCATRPDQTNETPGKSTSPHLSVARLHANPLFLGLLLLGLLLRALLPDAHQAGVGPRLPEQPVGAALDVGGQLALGDLAEGRGHGLVDAKGRADRGGGLGRLLVLGGVALLGLVGLAREDDEAALVLLEALDVDGERLLRQVLAAGVDGNADGAGVVLGNASGLEREKNISLFSLAQVSVFPVDRVRYEPSAQPARSRGPDESGGCT